MTRTISAMNREYEFITKGNGLWQRSIFSRVMAVMLEFFLLTWCLVNYTKH
ncbi:hypothetical protein BH10ACI2_BH10ACI2_00230 [soil metagenome]